jgi:hypothetical protein
VQLILSPDLYTNNYNSSPATRYSSDEEVNPTSVLSENIGVFSDYIIIIHNFVCNYYTAVCRSVVKIPIEFQK